MKIRLPYWILISIGLAIFSGIFFGEYMGVLEPVGRAFILLLKMSILPYLVFALMHGIGSLHVSQAKRLLKYGGLFLLLIWGIMFVLIYGFRLSFPELIGVSYYSAVAAPDVPKKPFLDLFIPGNIFNALANNIVPAVVLFSLIFGAALMVLKKKEAVLSVLETATSALSRITRWVIQISPIGVFALISSTTGTLSFHQFEKIAIYLFAIFVIAAFLTFWVLPLLVTTFTKIRYRQLMRNMQEGLLLAFSTGNIFVSLPYIIDAINHLSKEQEIQSQESQAIGRTLVPIVYNLPLVGNLMTLLFVLFLGYYYGIDFTIGQRLMLMPISLLTLAGPVTAGLNSLAFLIDQMHLPRDGLALFVETLSITRNFQALAGAMGIATFTLLTLFAFTKQLKIRISRLIITGIATVVLFVGITVGLHFGEPVPKPTPAAYPSFTVDKLVPSKVLRPGDAIPAPTPLEEGENTLDHIRRTGVLRVGYNPNAIPFTYFDTQGELVGYDIAYTYALGKTLDASILFIPFNYDEVAQNLQARTFDIAVSSVTVTPDRLEEMAYTQPTTVVTPILVVPDYERKRFGYYKNVRQMDGLRIGVLYDSNYEEIAREKFPNAVVIPLKNYDQILTDPSLDALLWSDVEALTWVKIHPRYTIVNITPPLPKQFYAYGLSHKSPELLEFTNYWLNLQKLDGFQAAEHKKWIQGESLPPPQRWSIIRNVLHWID